VAAALAFPAAASAAPATDQLPTQVGAGWSEYWDYSAGYWYHPEWGPGWNNGYPAPGWIPPQGWAPPTDWVPPQGWYPPPGYALPGNWRGPCYGPLFNLFHPRRCI
jgi:hypothetical protein